jgi:mono/diheme cytochrome c family protein
MMAAVLVLAGCGGSDGDAGPVGTDEPGRAGRELFGERILGPNAGCITCHSLDPDTTLVGPSIAGIATRAGERRPGVSAAEYLRESITDPSAFVVAGFDDGRMPADWAEVLTAEEIDALVAYLLTLA